MKCYNVTVTGKVQDIGFRSVVEYAGRLLGLPGLVFNAKDGSVKIICCGEDSAIREFFQQIRTRGEQRGAMIKDIKKQEVPFDIIDLPDTFSRVLADEDIDIGRKLDKGNELLIDIKRDTSLLLDIKRDTSVLPEIKAGMDSLNIKFDSFIRGQEEHNLHLERILEKLAER